MSAVDEAVTKANELIDKEERELKELDVKFRKTLEQVSAASKAGHGKEADDLLRHAYKLGDEIGQIARKIAGKTEARDAISSHRSSLADARAAAEKLVKDEVNELSGLVSSYNSLIVRLSQGDAEPWKQSGAELLEKIAKLHNILAGKLEVVELLPQS